MLHTNNSNPKVASIHLKPTDMYYKYSGVQQLY